MVRRKFGKSERDFSQIRKTENYNSKQTIKRKFDTNNKNSDNWSRSKQKEQLKNKHPIMWKITSGIMCKEKKTQKNENKR